MSRKIRVFLAVLEPKRWLDEYPVSSDAPLGEQIDRAVESSRQAAARTLACEKVVVSTENGSWPGSIGV